MIKAKVTLLEGSDHRDSGKTYPGYLWRMPEKDSTCIIYQTREELAIWRPDIEKEYGDKLFKLSEFAAVLKTSLISEVIVTGPKTGYFKTLNSIYKVELRGEETFNNPFSNFKHPSDGGDK